MKLQGKTEALLEHLQSSTAAMKFPTSVTTTLARQMPSKPDIFEISSD